MYSPSSFFSALMTKEMMTVTTSVPVKTLNWMSMTRPSNDFHVDEESNDKCDKCDLTYAIINLAVNIMTSVTNVTINIMTNVRLINLMINRVDDVGDVSTLT